MREEGTTSHPASSPPSTSCRALYKDKPQDFEQLARTCPSLEKHLIDPGRGRRRTIDFSKEDSVEELTKCLLLQDFSVHWERPPSSLIPPVPNRFTYILWLKDLLQSSSSFSSSSQCGEGPRPRSTVRGVDIGTGGSLIYALLGAAAFGWSFLATENCKYSLEWAEKNLASNPKLRDLITVRDSSSGEDNNGNGKVLFGVVDESTQYDFCMCNPPFFDVDEERTLHKPGHGGLRNELQCPGGERSFIERILRDSMRLQKQIKWYSTMTGKKKTLKAMVSKLRKASSQVKEIRTTTFVCGRTTRWGLAWTFHQTSAQQQAAGGNSNIGPKQQIAFGRKREAPSPSLDKNLVSAILYLEGQNNPRISRKHSFMVRESSRLTAQTLKGAIAEAMQNKVMWTESSCAKQCHGFESGVEETKGNPFELICKYSIPGSLNTQNKMLKTLGGDDYAAHGTEGDAPNRETYSESILKYGGKCVQFKVCIFQYSKDLVSVQSTLLSSHLQQHTHTHADLVLFHALLACLEGCLKQL